MRINPTNQHWTVQEAQQVVFLFTKAPTEPVQLRCDLNGKNASVEIIGIIMLGALPVLRLDLHVTHAAPDTISKITLVSVLKGNAAQEVQGKISIQKGAKRADGFLSHRTLTLSPGVKSISVPTLEIEEDDVKAGHAGATGPIDKEQLFYLQSRGLAARQAEAIIAEGFLEQVISKISDMVIREKVMQELWHSK